MTKQAKATERVSFRSAGAVRNKRRADRVAAKAMADRITAADSRTDSRALPPPVTLS